MNNIKLVTKDLQLLTWETMLLVVKCDYLADKVKAKFLELLIGLNRLVFFLTTNKKYKGEYLVFGSVTL